MAPPTIEVKDLVKRYNGREAVLDSVTFSVEDKEFVTVYGRSGCGKTTLLNIIGGLDRLSSGDVAIDGESLVGLTEDELARLRLEKIGFVFQDYNLLMDLTVKENVELPTRFSRRKDGPGVGELLRKFDIEGIAGEKANRISGGEAQRTAIARAMTNRPRIILADEPTGNLDEENTENVISMLQVAREEYGTTIVLATHDVDLAKHATRKVLIEGGKAVSEDVRPDERRYSPISVRF